MNGYILLHRKLLENAIFYKPDYFQIWVYILLRVNHKDNEFIWNNEKKLVKKGSGIFSQLKISQELGISIGTVSNVLKYLKTENQIEIKTTNKYTEIQVLKWEEYQTVESVIENRVKTKRKPRETNKHDKHDKEIYVVPTISEVEKYFTDNGFTKDLADRAFKHYADNDWKDKNGTKVENWKNKMNKVWFKAENKTGAGRFSQKVNGANGAIV